MTFQLPADSTLSGLALRIRDRDRALSFYRDLLGLESSVAGDGVRLTPGEGGFTLDLTVDPEAPTRPARSVGLYHFALLLPDRPSLAAVLRRLLEAQYSLEGASDHGVSEALYLHDPEGNGIELYRDRPRESWPRVGRDVAMMTEALDLKGLLATAPTAAPLHARTRLGHMHLSADDLAAGEEFYAGALGMNVTQRGYPGALFLAAGDYHHHLGLNTWGSRRRTPAGATGLIRYAWRIPGGALEALRTHLGEQGAPADHTDGRLVVTDPFGIAVSLRAT